MDVTETKNCRICMCELEDNNFFSIDLIGWEYLTYKEMFEKSLGYKIRPNEDQQFCFMCAGRLVKWEEFKSMCQKTQEIIAPVKEEEEELHSETIWYADPDDEESMVLESDMVQKGEHSYGMPPKDDQQVFGETYILEFKCFIKEYYTQPKTCYTLETFESTSVDDMMHQIWLFAKTHLKREIVYHDDRQTPVWHENGFPQEEDIECFILFQNFARKRKLTKPSFKTFKNWVNNPPNCPNLILYPYGKHVRTSAQWIKAQTVLNIKKPKSPALQNERVQNVSVPKENNDQICLSVTSIIQNFIGQQFKQEFDSFVHSGFIYFNDLDELLVELWTLVKSRIVREISFPDGITPTWDLLSFPSEKDLSKFLEIRDDTSARIYQIEHLSMDLVKTWKDRHMFLRIFPYSKNIKTAAVWKKVVPFLKKETEDVPVEEGSIEVLVEKLKEHHGQKFLKTYDECWKMWAYYIDCFGRDQHEHLVREAPPTQLLPYFENRANSIPVITHTTPSNYSFTALALWKQTKYSRNHIVLGKFKFIGDTLADVKRSVWEQIRPYVMREVLFNEEGVPEWSPKETPTEEDLPKFMSIFKEKRKRPLILSESMLEGYTNQKSLRVYIYQFTSAVTTKTEFKNVNKTLLPLDTATGAETQKLIEYLEHVSGGVYVSFHINWRMWVHYAMGCHPSKFNSQFPPDELKHLFIKRVSEDDYCKKRLCETEIKDDFSEKEEEEEGEKDKPLNVNELLQITDDTDRNQLKQCPFTGCTSIIKISSFSCHFKYCRHNPNRKLIFPCKFDGCKKSYGAKCYYNQHVKTCQFNPNRQTRPTHQCPYCTATPINVNTHIHLKHSKNTYICDICGVTKNTKGGLKSHILSVHNPVMLKCDKCPSEFKCKKTLKSHLARDHADKPLELNFKCEQCTYASYDRYNFLRHMRINHDPTQKKFTCEECNKAFPTPTLLRKHLPIHADTEFSCNICNHVSKTENGLKCHMTLHEEMKYECPVCQLKRRSAYEVRMHCKRKHPSYKLPPKGTIMKKTSRFNGKQMTYFPETDDDSNV